MIRQTQQQMSSQLRQTPAAPSHSPLFLATQDPLRVAAHHFLAQDLNNEACALIERKKNYAQAIRILKKALQLSQWGQSGEEGMTEIQLGPFEHCSLDAVLFHNDAKHDQSPTAQSGVKQKIHRQTPTFDDQESERFLHRQPLRVNQICIQGNYYMGLNLTVMILFNLAIAHQLLAMSTPAIFLDARIEFLDKALSIYELTNKAHNSCGCSESAGLRLKMLVMNNLGEIHRMSGNPKKYQMCLEYIMRGVMFILHGHHDKLNFLIGRHVLSSKEIDGIYRNMQEDSSSEMVQVFGGQIHAGVA